MDIPETLATLGPHDTRRRQTKPQQTRSTENIKISNTHLLQTGDESSSVC